MREIDRCPVCRGAEFRKRYEATFSGTADEAASYFLAQRDAVVHGRIVQCTACGFVLTNPQFDYTEYEQIYRKVSMSSIGDSQLSDANAVRLKRLARLVRTYLPVCGRLLDFGCGGGEFLLNIGGKQRVGLELGPASESQRDGIFLIQGDLLKLRGTGLLLEGTFDVITAWDVFEHLPRLQEYTRALAALLRPRGVLCVTVPNIDSLSARIFGRRWNSILLEHLWYFSPETLSLFMSRYGLSPESYRSIPYDASVSHLIRRFSQTYGLGSRSLGENFGRWVIPLPIGLMYAVFTKSS